MKNENANPRSFVGVMVSWKLLNNLAPMILLYFWILFPAVFRSESNLVPRHYSLSIISYSFINDEQKYLFKLVHILRRFILLYFRVLHGLFMFFFYFSEYK